MGEDFYPTQEPPEYLSEPLRESGALAKTPPQTASASSSSSGHLDRSRSPSDGNDQRDDNHVAECATSSSSCVLVKPWDAGFDSRVVVYSCLRDPAVLTFDTGSIFICLRRGGHFFKLLSNMNGDDDAGDDRGNDV